MTAIVLFLLQLHDQPKNIVLCKFQSFGTAKFNVIIVHVCVGEKIKR